jgi:hypothetical protein
MNIGNYYLLSYDPDPKVVGVKDGGSQVVIDRSGFVDKKLYDRIINFLGSYDSWVRSQEEPDFDVELQYVKLKKNAKLTDFLQFGPVLINCPFIVSDRARNTLEKFNIGRHCFYKAKVYAKDDNLMTYFLFFCMSLSFDVINFRQSILYSGLQYCSNNILDIVSLDGYNDYVANSNKIVQFHKYVLNSTFDNTLDLFVLGSKIFISDKLRYEILNTGLTGITILPAFGSNLKWPTIELQRDLWDL